MLQINYGHRNDESSAAATLAPVRHVALIWGLRIILRIDTICEGCLAVKDCLYQLDLLRPGCSGQDLIDAFNDKERCQSRLHELASESPKLNCPLSDNLRLLRELFRLDDIEVAALSFIAVKEALVWFHDLCDWALRKGHLPDLGHCIATATRIDLNELHPKLSPGAHLANCGLLSVHTAGPGNRADRLSLPPMLNGRMHAESLTPERLTRYCIRAAPTADCELGDFDMSNPALSLIRQCLAACTPATDRPPQVLLHGPPGTGKTEFARALAMELERTAFEIPETSPGGTAMNPTHRLHHFRLAQGLMAHQANKLLVFDEADQVLAWSFHSSERDREGWDKAWINRMLETTRVPCIWITNEIDRVHPAILRRFQIVQEMPRPGTERLTRIFRRHTGNTHLDEKWLRRLAETGRVTPGLIRNAAQVARQLPERDAKIAQATIHGVLDGHCKALDGRRLGVASDLDDAEFELPYRPEWLATEPNLKDLAAILENTRLAQVRLLFHGPPGTGKTALARELARRLDKPLIAAQASEILGCLVGQTEANLARLFDRAMAEDALLLLDEADSLLQDRETARQQWQVTQVNELLTQMEDYRGIMIVATNRAEALDGAVFRRLDVKVRFHCLSTEAIRDILGELLGSEACADPDFENRIQGLKSLTPGDFQVALRSIRLQGKALTLECLLNQLKTEISTKPGRATQRIGFV